MAARTPTAQQQAVIDAALAGHSFKVQALAGTGKTTTLELLARADETRRYLYLVFNKDMQDEAVKRMPKNMECRTGNSIAWQYIVKLYERHGLNFVDRFKNSKDLFLSTNTQIAKAFEIPEYEIVETVTKRNPVTNRITIEDETYILPPHRVVAHLKKAIEKFCISADDEIDINHFPEKTSYPPEATEHAKLLWEDIANIHGVQKMTYDHTVKLWALSRPDLSRSDRDFTKTYTAILIDEAQDTNPVFAKVYSDQSIQKIYVGDGNQAIYGFRGAVDELAKVDLPLTLTLNETWRFGPGLVEAPNAFLSALRSPTKIVALRSSLGILTPSGTMYNPDAVICRSNTGVIRAIFERLDAGQPIVVPKKYAENLASLLDTIAWFYGHNMDKPKVIHQDLEEYSSLTEVKEAIMEGDISSKIIDLVELMESRGYLSLKNQLLELTKHKKAGGVEVVTAHGSKGKEWDKVQIYDDFRGPKYIEEDYGDGYYIMPSDDELRLAYVATTRSMEELDLGSLDYGLRSI